MYQYNEFGPAKHSVYKIMDNEKGSSKDDKVKSFLKEYLNSLEKVSYTDPKIDIKSKMYINGFTISGARIQLESEQENAAGPLASKKDLQAIVKELEEISVLLD